ncbi:Uncharacterised protein [Niallia circulans]|nr:Uncharacterised protein [Niallia circulans]
MELGRTFHWGILGVIYGIYCSNSLRKLVLVGAAARES